MTTRKQVLLLSSACALIILLSGMVIISSATTMEEPAVAGTATTMVAVVWWLISVIGGLLILALIAAGSFAMMKKIGGLPEAKGQSGNKFWFVAVVGGAILLLAGVAYGWPAFWEWWRTQSFLFWWTVLVLPTFAVIAVKYRTAWWLVIIGVIIALLAADWTTAPNPLDWRQPNLSSANAAAAKRQAARPATAEKLSTTRSRVTTKTIVARPDKWSEFVQIPPWHKFEWYFPECVRVKNGLGQIKGIACPNERLDLGKHLSLPECKLSFEAITGITEGQVYWWSSR
ncbi:MAG: hypothetical protein HY481_01350 [Candidatus Vogelbacteria bacterium]|nr:hypothetical protein [Candidatus Vogelbacteria bacterium]